MVCCFAGALALQVFALAVTRDFYLGAALLTLAGLVFLVAGAMRGYFR